MASGRRLFGFLGFGGFSVDDFCIDGFSVDLLRIDVHYNVHRLCWLF